MKIIRKTEVQGSEAHVFGATGTWDSQRYILADDGVGFSFHVTTLYANNRIPLWYKNHVEAVYVIKGQLFITWVHEDGITPQGQMLYPGDMYLLDQHDKHQLQPYVDTTVACVFNPAVTGTEDHDEDGSYELAPEQDTVTVTRARYEELTGYESEANDPGYW